MYNGQITIYHPKIGHCFYSVCKINKKYSIKKDIGEYFFQNDIFL